MKLISVQSRGDRLVRIEDDSDIFIVRLKTFNKKGKRFIDTGFWFRANEYFALNAAEEWLKGAKV
ncbi:MAG: hypothetical protein BWY02_02866 [bacterium ADurb.Bin157]|nr:MAG: hypothetical protein BWY02_02866 [bacterium ADurb.Bin157]